MNFNEHIILNNGKKLSLQASQFHYCTPRDDSGPYSEVEICLFGDSADYLSEYHAGHTCSDEDNVYSYVPMELVCRYINENGGVTPSPSNLNILMSGKFGIKLKDVEGGKSMLARLLGY